MTNWSPLLVSITVVSLSLPWRSHAFISSRCKERECHQSPLLFSSSSADEDGSTAAETQLPHSDLTKALHKMERIMAPDFFITASPTLKAFYTKLVKNVEVQDSPISGRGLFAKKPIKAHTIVSFYPAHALGTDEPFVFAPQDTVYFHSHPFATSEYLHATDQPIFQRSSCCASISDVLYLDVNPNRAVVEGWTSQFINDGATVESFDEAGVLDYYSTSTARKNCIHIPFGPSPILATLTTKKVKKGQELLTSYGGVYWCKDQSVQVTPPIQAQIQASANDLFAALTTSQTFYQNVLHDLTAAVEAL